MHLVFLTSEFLGDTFVQFNTVRWTMKTDKDKNGKNEDKKLSRLIEKLNGENKVLKELNKKLAEKKTGQDLSKPEK